MNLYIIRHAKAESFASSSADSDRELTELGRQQSADIAKLIDSDFVVPEIVLTSPVLRAKQTAEIMCASLATGSALIEPWLRCGMRPNDAMNGLAGYHSFQSVAVVGHEPDLSYLIMHLLGVDSLPFKVKKASLTVLSDALTRGRKTQLKVHRAL